MVGKSNAIHPLSTFANLRGALRTLHDTTPDFMLRFISYFDGEKDPRNLMVVFSILKVPMTEWTIGGDAQVGDSVHVYLRHF
jgi:hypothetical protein